MNDLEKSIIKTALYYEALGQYPLTAVEIYRYLQKENDVQTMPSFSQFWPEINRVNALESHNGFFFTKGNRSFYGQRISRQKIAIAKWHKIRRVAVYLGLTPFLRGLVVSGSLAFSNTKKKSDIDLLVFTKKGRIWTCRTLLSLLLQLIGQRRHGQIIENKICLNHYIAEGHFAVSLENLSNAQLYSHLIPLTDFQNFVIFQSQNAWMTKFLFGHPHAKEHYLRRINENTMLFAISCILAKIIEWLLSDFLGNALEKALAKWQRKRIEQKTYLGQPAENQLYLSEHALLFHYPVSKNNEVMSAYFNKLRTFPFL
ncbi:MAG: hypothetical protein V1845_01875 [bacterium]